MKQNWQSLFLITLPLAILGSLASINTARAQITPDNSLGAESSVVTPNVDIEGVPSDRIDGGATRGSNLFHSFQEFNVREGRGAYFSNPAGIENILSRVTGGNVSNILGTLGVLGDANLFFINPNGIVFGPNARLDVRGSFLGSTANSLIFNNGFEFSATNPQAPPLLTVNIPIGLRFRENPGSITNRSVVAIDNSGTFPVGLQVPSGNSLALVGGDISLLDGGSLTAAGGRIELGGLAGAGTVGLETTGNTFRLNFPSNSLLSNLTLANNARVGVRGSGGGDIAVNTNTFSATNGGRLVGGIEGTATKNGGDITVNSNEFNISGVGQRGAIAGVFQQVVTNASGNAGNITINTNSFNASSGAEVQNGVLPEATGKTGDISITARSLSLTDGALLRANIDGKGDAGRILVQTDGTFSLTGDGTGIFSRVTSPGIGNAGIIDIKAGSLSLSDRAKLSTSTFGKGNAGGILVKTNDSVSLANGDIFSTVEAGAEGKGGDITIKAGSLSLTYGAQIQTLVRQASASENLPAGRGDAGNVNIDVRDRVTIARVSKEYPSAIFSNVEAGAEGKGGDINIKAGLFSLTDGARLVTSNSGKGNAGSVFVQANDSVSLANGDIFSNVESGGVGNGGNITIKAGSLSLADGAQIQTLVREASEDGKPGGRGNAGNVNIDARDHVTIAGVSNGFPSTIYSTLRSGAEGKGGDINIKARSLSLSDGAKLSTSTFGKGNAGSILVQANDSVSLANGDIFSTVEAGAVGNGGSISITAGSLSLTDGARLNTSTFGQGNAGNVFVQANDTVSLADSDTIIFSNVEREGQGDAGGIFITAGSLSLTNGAQLQSGLREAFDTLPGGRGNGGKVSINVRDTVKLAGVNNKLASAIFTDVGSGAEGKGGDINIRAGSLSLTDGARLSADTSGKGDAGRISLQTDGTVSLAGDSTAIFSDVNSTGIGNAGMIEIKAGSLSLTDGARLSSSTYGQGNAGSVRINASNSISFNGEGNDGSNSGVFSSVEEGGEGNAGGIELTTTNLSLTNGATISASTWGRGNSGSLVINATDTIYVDGEGKDRFDSGIFSTVESSGVGNAGGIEINTKNLFLSNGGVINASTFGKGNAGSVNINATGTISADGEDNEGFNSGIVSQVVEQEAEGDAGGIKINTNNTNLI